MAAVFIPPSPHSIGMMASRRAPLSNLPNATNSPYRTAIPKRSRPQTIDDDVFDQRPAAKKQIIEVEQENPRTPSPRKRLTNQITKRVAETKKTPVNGKELAQKERNPAAKAVRQEPKHENSLENLRQWRRHYKNVMPTFVFYFESVPLDVRKQLLRQISSFGAREAKFFSREVSHVITTRSPPTNDESGTSTQVESGTNSPRSREEDKVTVRTINPAFLERPAEIILGMAKSRFTFENSLSKKVAQTAVLEHDQRKQNTGSTDILKKAKEMNMKIWQVEKIVRILKVMADGSDEDRETMHAHGTRKERHEETKARPALLSQLISREERHRQSQREALLATAEIVPFRGPHIYIRCMDEKTKPIMVREYKKPVRKEDGDWPQFRSASTGKCPFIEELPTKKKCSATGEQKAKRSQRAVAAENVKKEGASAETNLQCISKMEPPVVAGRKRALAEIENNATVSTVQPITQLPSAPALDPTFTRAAGVQNVSIQPGMKFGLGGEPMASGMQASNVTSAIRSNAISSTAAHPGTKAGISKEMHDLRRKVVLSNSGSVSGQSGISATPHADVASLRRAVPARAAKAKAQEKFGGNLQQIYEDPVEGDEEHQKRLRVAKAKLQKRDRDPKPGYCENCREKFDDFDEHIEDRKHRKWASVQSNFSSLDDLLDCLKRPLRREA